MSKIVDFEEAEKRARVRDLELEKKSFQQEHNGVSKDQLEKAMDLISQATGKEHYIGTKRAPQSRVRFVQFMQENLGHLNKKRVSYRKRKKSFFKRYGSLYSFFFKQLYCFWISKLKKSSSCQHYRNCKHDR
ncbi:hypothetical protein ACFQDF_25565 [Ectobacillus funiculus]